MTSQNARVCVLLTCRCRRVCAPGQLLREWTKPVTRTCLCTHRALFASWHLCGQDQHTSAETKCSCTHVSSLASKRTGRHWLLGRDQIATSSRYSPQKMRRRSLAMQRFRHVGHLLLPLLSPVALIKTRPDSVSHYGIVSHPKHTTDLTLYHDRQPRMYAHTNTLANAQG